MSRLDLFMCFQPQLAALRINPSEVTGLGAGGCQSSRVCSHLWLRRVICRRIYLESIGNQLAEVKKKKGWGEDGTIAAPSADRSGTRGTEENPRQRSGMVDHPEKGLDSLSAPTAARAGAAGGLRGAASCWPCPAFGSRALRRSYRWPERLQVLSSAWFPIFNSTYEAVLSPSNNAASKAVCCVIFSFQFVRRKPLVNQRQQPTGQVSCGRSAQVP